MGSLEKDQAACKSKRVEKVTGKSVISLLYSNIIIDVFIRKSY